MASTYRGMTKGYEGIFCECTLIVPKLKLRRNGGRNRQWLEQRIAHQFGGWTISREPHRGAWINPETDEMEIEDVIVFKVFTRVHDSERHGVANHSSFFELAEEIREDLEETAICFSVGGFGHIWYAGDYDKWLKLRSKPEIDPAYSL